MYDYFYHQWGTFEGVSGISSCIYNDLHTVLDQYGTVSQQTPGSYMDFNNPVLMSFVTRMDQPCRSQGYQRLYEMVCLLTTTAHTLADSGQL